MIHTANSDPWGSGLFVHGVALPNSASIQPYSIAAIPRGARLPGPLAHFMMLHQTSTGAAQRAVDLAVSVVGRSLHSCSLQLLRLLADFGGLVNVKVSMHTLVNSISRVLTHACLCDCWFAVQTAIGVPKFENTYVPPNNSYPATQMLWKHAYPAVSLLHPPAGACVCAVSNVTLRSSSPLLPCRPLWTRSRH